MGKSKNSFWMESKLSYIFTSNGLQKYRTTYMSDREEITSILDTLAKSVFTEDEYNSSFIIAAFDSYVDEVEFPQRTSEMFWKVMEERIFSKQDLKGGKPISLMCLAKIECILLSLPATEAIAERCFLVLKRLLNDYNW